MEERKGRTKHIVTGEVSDVKKQEEELNLESVGNSKKSLKGILKVLKKSNKKTEGK